jgi:hypothetical protein
MAGVCRTIAAYFNGKQCQICEDKKWSPKQATTQVNTGFDSWGFGTESFSAAPTGSTQISRPMGEGNISQRYGDARAMESKPASQPAGWAGF